MNMWQHHWPEVTQIARDEHLTSDLYPHLDRTDMIAEFLHIAEDEAERVALVEAGKVWTYGDLVRAVRSLACRVAQQVQDSDRIVLVLPNSVEFVVAFLACIWAGAIVVPLNPRLGMEEFAHIFLDARPRFVITLKDDGTLLNGDYPDSVRWWHIDAQSLREAVCEDNVDPRTGGPDHVPVILYTSGTTGRPKGVMLTHRNILTSTTTYQCIFGLTKSDRTLIAVPLFHVTGLIGQLLAILLVGGTAVLVRKYHASRYMDLIARERVSFIFAVPTLLTLAFYHDDVWQDPQHLRIIASGGAPIAPALIDQIRRKLPGVAFYNTYGMTEVASPATILPPGQLHHHSGTVGLPVPGMTMRVVDLSTGADRGPGQMGQLLMRGPMVSPGYWRNPDETSRTFREGWLHSGDIASIDGEGFVTIHGRIKDMINRGGEKVYALDVEAPLSAHPAVQEVAVYGIPDAIWGEQVACAVSFKPGMSATNDALTAWLAERVAKFKIPSEFRVWTELPHNANGKIDKQALKAQHEGKLR